MQLIKPQTHHLQAMMNWFPSEQAFANWSGPDFRYPYDLVSFSEDLKLDAMASFSLVCEQGQFYAFGQYYQRLGKCHLARLIVNPEFRGKGIAAELMHCLCESGLQALQVSACSLFVLAHNKNAIKAYEKFGFSFVDYPESLSMENCLYMVTGSESH